MAIQLERIIAPDLRKGLSIDWNEARAWARRTVVEERKKLQATGKFPTARDEYITRVGTRVGHGTEQSLRLGQKVVYTRVRAGEYAKQAAKFVKLVMSRVVVRPKSPSDMRSKDQFRQRHLRDSFVMQRNGSTVVGVGPNFERRARLYIKTNGAEMEAKGDTLTLQHLQAYSVRAESKKWLLSMPNGIMRGALKSARRAAGYRAIQFDPNVVLRPAPADIGQRKRMVSYMDQRSRKKVSKRQVFPSLTFGPAG